MGEIVAGLDGFKAKWVAVVLEEGCFQAARLFDTIIDASKSLKHATQIAVDAPIGFPITAAGRQAEVEATRVLGKRSRSVFPTFPREVYLCKDHRAAGDLAERLTGSRISRQSFDMRSKILTGLRPSPTRVSDGAPRCWRKGRAPG